MTQIITFIIAIFIAAIPCISISYIMKWSFIKESIGRSIFAALGLIALSYLASLIALDVYEFGIPKHIMPNKLDNVCDMTSILFIFLGFVFTVLTLIFGVLFTYTNYKTRNTLK